MFQEYELAEDEVSISLDEFRSNFCNPDGSVKYVPFLSTRPVCSSGHI